MISDKLNPMKICNLKFTVIDRSDNDTFYSYTLNASDGVTFLSSISKNKIYDFAHIRNTFEKDYKLFICSIPSHILNVGDVV